MGRSGSINPKPQDRDTQGEHHETTPRTGPGGTGWRRPSIPDPPHAPAHGYYKKDKQAKHHRGKSGAVYVHDYGIASGRCNRDEIGAVIGGVTATLEVDGRQPRDVLACPSGEGEWSFHRS